MIVIVAVATILHLGPEVFLPLSMAVLLTFALSCVVSFLRNRGLPHIASVLAAVMIAFAAIGLFMLRELCPKVDGAVKSDGLSFGCVQFQGCGLL